MNKYEGHTPGPWWAEGAYIAAQVAGGRPNGEIIGRMEPSISTLGIDREANAKLAADSPKLLRRIERLHRWLRELGMHKSLWRQNFNQSGEWVQRCIDRDLENGKLREALADSPALAERTRRALNKLRYMSSGGSFLAPTHSDIGHLIRILEGEEDKE